jgi:LuxR family transcriptional regulator, maltose regulon positive regulatory protein
LPGNDRRSDEGGELGGLGSALLELKFRPPPARRGTVARSALVEHLLGHDAESVLIVTAPPGYGKSTVLAQWSVAQTRRVAWSSLDEQDNDPSVLAVGIALALQRSSLVSPAVVDSLRSRTHSASMALTALSQALTSTPPVTVVLDHLEALKNPEALDVVNELAVRLPDGSRLALASRTQPPLPAPLLRSRRDLVEIGVGQLAMDRHEAQQLFLGVGASFDDDEVDRLVEQTEGWPAGLYLAALAAQMSRQQPGTAFAFRGNDRLMADYVRAEIFSRLDRTTFEFLTCTALLEELCGPLCDAVLAGQGSQGMLESLDASNLFLVPLDRHRGWYRYHRLFRELLVAELERTRADLVPVLHARAARWLEANRMPEAALGHAQQAGDVDTVARLVTLAAQPAYASGRATTIRRWFEWFRSEGLIERYPSIAILGAELETMRGQPASAERWAMTAELGTFDAPLPDGSPIEAWRAFMRAMMTPSGVEQMRADARSAQRLLAPGSPFRAGALLFEGLSYLLDGDGAAADPILAHAADVAVDLAALPVATVAFAERALLAVANQDWEQAGTLSARALEVVHQGRLDEYLEAAFAYVAAARVAIQHGELPAARELVAAAARARPLLTYALPCGALVQLELAKAYVKLADPAGARTVLRDLFDILRQRPRMGILPEQATRLRQDLDALRRGPIGASSLTAAELRLIPYLPTHLSIQEIGERLFVSRNTVKSQAVSVYRKLGVSSRGDAVTRAQEIGLLPT